MVLDIDQGIEVDIAVAVEDIRLEQQKDSLDREAVSSLVEELLVEGILEAWSSLEELLRLGLDILEQPGILELVGMVEEDILKVDTEEQLEDSQEEGPSLASLVGPWRTLQLEQHTWGNLQA
jgi:hypothetical protein